MGLIINAKCGCGFNEKLYIGGGMATYRVKDMMPAITIDEREFSLQNYYNFEDLKKKFRFYDNPRMFHANENSNFIKYGQITLSVNRNYCPKCHQYCMDFIKIGNWD
ncbi:MAG: hypothetical protein ORN55_02410 [Chitinophagaceae bacterium]|nr:hypothetical protein [Chitinophagaceae bacterium]